MKPILKIIYANIAMIKVFARLFLYSLNSFDTMTFISLSETIINNIIYIVSLRFTSSIEYLNKRFMIAVKITMFITIIKLIFGVYRSVCLLISLLIPRFISKREAITRVEASAHTLKNNTENNTVIISPIGEIQMRCLKKLTSVKRKGRSIRIYISLVLKPLFERLLINFDTNMSSLTSFPGSIFKKSYQLFSNSLCSILVLAGFFTI